MEDGKTISLGEFDKHATDYLSELAKEILNDEGIYPESFSFSLEVTYLEN